MSTVIAAIDLGSSSGRVLYHASGFARLLSADLAILHVSDDAPTVVKPSVREFCERQGPYQINPDEVEFVIRAGAVSDVIHDETRKRDAALVVIGALGHGAIAKLFLGSTCEAVLANAPAPVLVVPPVDLDIVSISHRPTLNCGAVLAAVDLEEDSAEQLSQAGGMARLAGQPLLLMTVAGRLNDHDAMAKLRERAHALEPVRPRAVIVRRGNVAEEISRCAVAEEAGLVVMGVRAGGRGRPGATASAVIGTKRAFVLVVPGAGAGGDERPA
jgi:nucleotide-binding universal stress UspA family protein